MDAVKLSLSEFNDYKRKLKELIIDSKRTVMVNSYNPDFDLKSYEKQLEERYLLIQNELLSFDLSDIPFDAWEHVSIKKDGNGGVDFSKAKANIDFKLIDYWGPGNFNGCNIRNLQEIKRYIDEESFDKNTINNYPKLFLSDTFSKEFRDKYYNCELEISDLINLTGEQKLELKKKDILEHLKERCSLMYNTLGLDKMIELYKYSALDYLIVDYTFDYCYKHRYFTKREKGVDLLEIIEYFGNTDINHLKNECVSFFRKNILNGNISSVDPKDYPHFLVEEMEDIFLTNAYMDFGLRNRYMSRNLTIDDVKNNIDLFKNMSIANFLSDYRIKELCELLGEGRLQKLISEHRDFYDYLESKNLFWNFSRYINKNEKNLDKRILNAVKNFCLFHYFMREHSALNCISSFGLKIVNEYNSYDKMGNYSDDTLVLNREQQFMLSYFGIDNIKKFEEETKFFSLAKNGWFEDFDLINLIGGYLIDNSSDFNFYSTIPYDEFRKCMADLLNKMRIKNFFRQNSKYDYITGKFREDYPYIFIDENAPPKLKDAFYSNKIDLEFLFNKYEYIPYLLDKNIDEIINASLVCGCYNSSHPESMKIIQSVKFCDFYIERYGKEELLKLFCKYGKMLDDMSGLVFDVNSSEEEIDSRIKKFIYNRIVKTQLDYEYLEHFSDFVSEYPDIFLTYDELSGFDHDMRKLIRYAFYSRRLAFYDLKKFPELVDVLKNKNLKICFGRGGMKSNSNSMQSVKLNYVSSHSATHNYYNENDLKLIDILGNDNFLYLCSSYGKYIERIYDELSKVYIIDDNKIYFKRNQQINNYNNKTDYNFEDELIEVPFSYLCREIERIIIRRCFDGEIRYFPEDAPQFLKERCPELFLDEDAPLKLKNLFYHREFFSNFTFEEIRKNKEWLKFLNGMAVEPALIKGTRNKEELKKYFDLFGLDDGLKLGIQRCETVDKMIDSNSVSLMKDWYDKTGRKFIPDYVVMQNFSLQEADKFLLSGSNWSSLMKIKEFANNEEGRDAMLKLAYSFGVFDNDSAGLKKLHTLLTDLPRKISSDYEKTISMFDLSLKYGRSLDENIEDEVFENLVNTYINEGGILDDNKEGFEHFYRKNEDDSYTLAFNPQSYPKTTEILRYIFSQNDIGDLILSSDRAHQLFGGFQLIYDKDFRDFLLANLDEIMNNSEYYSLISNIQKQFSQIKLFNSNRTLTLDLAVSFVKSNKYSSVEVGNEKVAEVSAIAGYSQEDFDKLQQIYNYGKQRTFSSIPKIENTMGDYSYEILRLDDPLAMAIGTLTDCCQELGDCAEMCMEHSMVDKNGRVFVIKDKAGNVVAQSWVWRNKDVLCFDNIEIPEKAFDRARKDNLEQGRKEFSDTVYKIYKLASHELIEEDNKIYLQLLESGKITKEQYDGLRLGKVTVGSGYNDIASTLRENLKMDNGRISRPLYFDAPVQLSRGLYTRDSSNQYILEEREDRSEYDGETLSVHSDDFTLYTDDNFNEKDLYSLERLEIVTRGNDYNLNTELSEYDEKDNIVSSIARNYGLNSDKTKIVMNPNFAIIYEEYDNKIVIGDLLFNIKVNSGDQQIDISNVVKMQIKLALEQISNEKTFDVSNIRGVSLKMFNDVMMLSNEIDIERGIGHAK